MPLDRASGSVAAFAGALRDLRQQAGSPTYSALSRRTGLSPSVLSEATRGRRIPTWVTVQAFVLACGGDPQEWRDRWMSAAGQSASSVVSPSPLCAPSTPAVLAPAPEPSVDNGPLDSAEPISAPPRIREWSRFRVALVTAGVLVSAAAVSTLLSARPSPSMRPSSSQSAPPSRAALDRSATAAAGAWSRITGPGCPPDTDGAQVDVDKGWTLADGGWTGGGCNGTSVMTALSNSATWWNLTVGWAFEPHGSSTPATCELSVYIPDSPDASGTATYVVLGKNIDNLPPLPDLTRRQVQQAGHRGSWVSLGTFDFPEGVVNLELYNVGPGTAHIAADSARATCA